MSMRKKAFAHAQERCPGMDETDIVFSMCVDDYEAGYKQCRADAAEIMQAKFSEVVELRQTRAALAELMAEEQKDDEHVTKFRLGYARIYLKGLKGCKSF